MNAVPDCQLITDCQVGTMFTMSLICYICFAFIVASIHVAYNVVGTAGGASQGQEVLDSSRRPTDARWVTDQEVAFADGYPALIVSEVCYIIHYRHHEWVYLLKARHMSSCKIWVTEHCSERCSAMYQCRVHDQKWVVYSAYKSAYGILMQGRTGRSSCHSSRTDNQLAYTTS